MIWLLCKLQDWPLFFFNIVKPYITVFWQTILHVDLSQILFITLIIFIRTFKLKANNWILTLQWNYV